MQHIVSCERRYDGRSNEAWVSGGLRARGAEPRGILRLPDHQRRAAVAGSHGIDAVSAAQAAGRRELHCRALRRAQWAATQVLSHHNRGPRSRGGLYRGMERGGGHLPLRA